MATSFGALCTDFYVNQKLSLKMDLPSERESVLHFFDRVRKTVPAMKRFRRYEEELALESSRREAEYSWLALRRNSVRSGHVNPASMEAAHKLHRLILQTSPYHLTLSPLDVDYLELLYGFDLEASGNHDELVYEALYANTSLGHLLDMPGGKVLDVQPVLGLSLNDNGTIQAYFEAKTRPRSRRGSSKAYRGEPISLMLSLRRYGPIDHVDDLPSMYDDLAQRADQLATDKFIPYFLAPIARLITSSSS
jgi:hypothetical protein